MVEYIDEKQEKLLVIFNSLNNFNILKTENEQS